MRKWILPTAAAIALAVVTASPTEAKAQGFIGSALNVAYGYPPYSGYYPYPYGYGYPGLYLGVGGIGLSFGGYPYYSGGYSGGYRSYYGGYSGGYRSYYGGYGHRGYYGRGGYYGHGAYHGRGGYHHVSGHHGGGGHHGGRGHR
ncbi:hypothetical protein [Fimbriiglobus ruber]|uniref:Glycine-rich protein n=1 Tax=Fimbriiglobus ruber TaxID=1908690 RepID=A0A225E1T0_9BACT|nr:hypothetical protein [Fimbriiglobus ruber]OWK42327.1 glycine-rich protein [Fimbriiglobus ruber]